MTMAMMDRYQLTAGSINQTMLLIKSIDLRAHLEFSEWTKQWYVEARIDIGGDGLLSGGSEHRDTPQEAVVAYMERLCEIDLDHYLVTNAGGDARRHWRWNGAAFAELPYTYKAKG